MTMLTQDDIARLSPPERLTLIGALWDSLADAEQPVPPAQLRELARRVDDLERNRPLLVGWEQLKAELAAQVP